MINLYILLTDYLYNVMYFSEFKCGELSIDFKFLNSYSVANNLFDHSACVRMSRFTMCLCRLHLTL